MFVSLFLSYSISIKGTGPLIDFILPPPCYEQGEDGCLVFVIEVEEMSVGTRGIGYVSTETSCACFE